MEFRRANFEFEEELRFIAEFDSKIPLQYDLAYTWSEQSISAKVDQYKKQISSEDFFEVATDNEKIVGFHIVKKVPYPPDLSAGAIFTLWTDPIYSGNGIASQLKSRAEKWAKQQNIAYIVTNVHSGNSKMLEINKKFGFELVQYAMRKRI